MDKKNVILRIVLCSLLAGLGSMMGALLTLFLIWLFPSCWEVAPSLFVLNSGFFAAYWSSYCMKACAQASYFISVFAMMSVIVCLRFYGVTWFCVLNILGYFLTIAGFVLVDVNVRLIRRTVKRMLSDSGDQKKNG